MTFKRKMELIVVTHSFDRNTRGLGVEDYRERYGLQERDTSNRKAYTSTNMYLPTFESIETFLTKGPSKDCVKAGHGVTCLLYW